MSVGNHPNINAVGFTCDIVEAFDRHLRGVANTSDNRAYAGASFKILNKHLVDFVTKVSQDLDDEFGIR